MQGTASIVANLFTVIQSPGDAEAYGIHFLLASVNGVSSSYLLSEVLSALALLNLFMQKKLAEFSKLPFVLKSTLDLPNSLRESDASWCTAAETAISNLETEHGITIKLVRDQHYGNQLLCQLNSFKYKWLFPTMIH